MSGRWNVESIGGKYRIQKNNSAGTPLDYFTVSGDGNIGINNSSPLNKLHVNGNTTISGKAFISNDIVTSNIVGYEIENGNNLKINKTAIYTNNVLEIYGKTLLEGRLGIGNNNPLHEIDINGTIRGTLLIGNGSNITNIHTSNINSGILNTARGGTGTSVINPSQLLIGGSNNNIVQFGLLRYNENTNTLISPNISGDGRNITNINALNITEGPLRVSQGGIGVKSLDVIGGILLGNNTESVVQTRLFRWEEPTTTSTNLNSTSNNFNTASNYLIIGGNIKLPQFGKIYINEKPFSYDEIGEYALASSTKSGIVKIGSDFRISPETGIISIANTGSSKWGVETTNGKNAIFFPTDTTSSTYSVSIGGRDNASDNSKLNVFGDINTINGIYKINGINVIQNNSNNISTRINNFTLDNINAGVINGGINNKCFTLTNNNFVIAANSGNFIFKNTVVFEQGITVNGSVDIVYDALDYTKIGALMVTGNQSQSAFICEQIGGGNIATFKFKGVVECVITNTGSFGIGGNGRFKDTQNINESPIEKLHVIGNIIATGKITSFYSDERLKTFTSNITNSLEIIDSLSGYRYVPNNLAIEKGFKYENEIGLSAQQVQKVLPEVVKIAPFDSIIDENGEIISESGNNYLTICYERLGAVFVEAIKELNAEMKKLKDENNTLKEDIKNIKKILNI